jgi:ubiquinone/menaquinone biosynthesis C-methylase UbiE
MIHPEERTVYENAVTTGRRANNVAARHGFHGFHGARNLAQSLPPGAEVLDVGAGVSGFGAALAAERSDIHVTNFDFSYHNPDILRSVLANAPPNISYVQGDVTKLLDHFDPEQFDWVGSNWLLQHLSIDDMGPALAGAEAMFTVTKMGGKLSVGPQKPLTPLPLMRRKTFRIVKDETHDARSVAEEIVEKTQLPPSLRAVQRVINNVITPTLGTSRYMKREKYMPRVYYRPTEKYIPIVDPRAAYLAGKLGVAASKYWHDQRLTKAQ